jgi:hypothetical protein
MAPMASAGIPPKRKNQEQVEPSPAHPQFSKNLKMNEIWTKISPFFLAVV